jgi:PilZ domain
LLEGIEGTFKAGEVISITHKDNKARFRVAWVGVPGTEKAGQIGVQSVDASKCIWDSAILPALTDDTYAAKTKERRQHERVPCKLGAELYMQGASGPVRVLLRDISVGGCFASMPTLPPENGALKVVVWLNDTKLTLQGVMVSRRAGFGISIKFTGVTAEVREKLERFIHPKLVILRS